MNHTPPEVIRFRAALTEYREVTTFLAKHGPDYPGYRLAEDKAKMLHDELETSFCKRSPLPFREASEKPEPYTEFVAVQKTDKGHVLIHGITGNERNPELGHVDEIGEYDLSLNAESYIYEADILNLFQAWKKGKQ